MLPCILGMALNNRPVWVFRGDGELRPNFPPGFGQRKDGRLSLRRGCALLMSLKDVIGMEGEFQLLLLG